jgi:hypothetical protein
LCDLFRQTTRNFTTTIGKTKAMPFNIRNDCSRIFYFLFFSSIKLKDQYLYLEDETLINIHHTNRRTPFEKLENMLGRGSEIGIPLASVRSPIYVSLI